MTRPESLAFWLYLFYVVTFRQPTYSAMKKLLCFSFISFFITFNISAQNIFITFTGTGESTVVDSVRATNLTTNESITLPGNETLNLSISTGLFDINEPHTNTRLYPNPFKNNATLTFTQKQAEEVTVSIRNLIGQVIAQSEFYLETGNHKFEINMNARGVYLIDIIGKTERKSIKAICTESGAGSTNIISTGMYHSNGNNQVDRNKSWQNEYILAFTIGDVIHFSCRGGKHTTIITDTPSASINYEIEFVECTDTDNKTYEIVKIGDQKWMAENLAYLPTVSPSNVESFTDKHYYVYDYDSTLISEAKATDSYNDYGALYNWEAAKASCPTGWHLPSVWEWADLFNYIGGFGVAGKKLKSTTGWDNNGNGDNNSGFNGLPGGSCSTYSGFKDLGSWAKFWTSTPDGTYNADGRGLWSDYDVIVTIHAGRTVGLSVRCIKN